MKQRRATSFTVPATLLLVVLSSCLLQTRAADISSEAANLTMPELLLVGVAPLPPGMRPDGGGYIPSILTELFKRSDVGFSLQILPPRRSLKDADTGITDAAIAPYPDLSFEYPNLLPVVEALMPVELAGMYLRDDIRLRTLSDFLNYRIAYVRGWKRAESLFADHTRVQVVRTPALLLEMLAQDRVDVIFFSAAPARHLAQGMPRLKDMKVSEVRLKRYLYLHLNSRHEQLIEPLRQELIAMKGDGRMDALLRGYGVAWH